MTESIEEAGVLLRAFAEPTRLRILNLLLEGELCVCDLCGVLDVLQPSISRHLAYLVRARLVRVRQEGKWKYYAIAAHASGTHRRLLNCLRDCLRDIDVLAEDLRRLRAHPGARCC